MALITVRFYSLWRSYLGTDSTTLQADRIDDALTQLEEKFGYRLREKLQAAGIHLDGKIQDYSLILLNGIALRNLKSTVLKEGDVLHVFPPAVGG
ncbi:MAG TPA: MoaD/ThiS family protein [Dehalococcoidia bacterium]|nr:MoaD/ThiS family protein [Dehalococcoidia bacterium]